MYWLKNADSEIVSDKYLLMQGSFCFIGETEIYVNEGYKEIKDIKIGDMIYTLNEETNEIEEKKVTNVSKSIVTGEFYTIIIGEDEITATKGHNFLVENKGWIPVEEIEAGDKLINEQKQWITVDRVEEQNVLENTEVYNLTVEDNHNFFVGESKILAHNASSPVKCSATTASGSLYEEVSVSGEAQTLVTVSNSIGDVYFSTETQLTSSNYSTAGSTTLPTAAEVGQYTIYYYAVGNNSYNDKSGSVVAEISY